MNQGNPERLGNPVPVGPASPVRPEETDVMKMLHIADALKHEAASLCDYAFEVDGELTSAVLTGAAKRLRTIAEQLDGASPVRDPAPPSDYQRGYEDGSNDYAKTLEAVRGVRDPSPPEPTDREIGLRSALNAALVDLRIFRGVDDHFVQALEKLVEQTGVRGSGVVPPEEPK